MLSIFIQSLYLRPYLMHQYKPKIIMKKKSSIGGQSKPKSAAPDNRYILEPIQTVEGEIRMKKYAKIKVVGQGSYSKCFLVKNTESQSTYVVKIIPKRKLQVLEKEKLIYQIKIHQSLSHPNVVHLDHWFQDEDYQYIFMEYCSKGNLENKLKEVSQLPEKQIKKYGVQIVKAIQYCHTQKILHRDLKLSNFYLDQNEDLKLGDFGFACQLASDYDRKRQTCGTPNYIAPEAISGFGYSFSSDVWAIGVILFRMKYGICPFEGETVKKTLQNVKICNFTFPKIPKISPELKSLILAIFNINYDQRLSTQDILNHSFFQNDEVIEKDKKQQKVSPKRSFSFSRFFGGSSKQKNEKKDLSPRMSQRQGMISRESRNNASGTKKIEQPKRYNSCETLKQMKQIFKSKSRPTLITTQGKQQNSATSGLSNIYYNMSMTENTMSSGPNNYTQYCPTLTGKSSKYNIIEYGYNGGVQYLQGLSTSQNGSSTYTNSNNNSNSNTGSRVSRLNEFIKNQVTSLEDKGKTSKNTSNSNAVNKIKTLLNHEPSLNIKSSAHQKINSSKSIIEKKIDLPISSRTQRDKDKSQQVIIIADKPKLEKDRQKQKFKEKQKQKTKHTASKSLSTLPQDILFDICKKIYIPLFVQQEKDLTIVHYKPTLKQIIWPTVNKSFLIHRDTKKLYSMTGQKVNMGGLPKVFKYIIENKIDIKPYEEDEFDMQPNQLPSVNEAFKYLPHSWIPTKDGIIFKYDSTGSPIYIGKLHAHEGFLLINSLSSGEKSLIGSHNSFVYMSKNGKLQICDGVVLMRIYVSWAKGILKL